MVVATRTGSIALGDAQVRTGPKPQDIGAGEHPQMYPEEDPSAFRVRQPGADEGGEAGRYERSTFRNWLSGSQPSGGASVVDSHGIPCATHRSRHSCGVKSRPDASATSSYPGWYKQQGQISSEQTPTLIGGTKRSG